MRPFVVVATLSAVLTASLSTGTALGISRAEVDEACADSQEAYDIYRGARSDFEVAAVALDEANAELDDAEYQEQRIRNDYEARQEEKVVLSTQVESQAVELYMQAASGPSMGMVSLSSPSEALTAYEFLRANADQSMQSVNDLAAVSSELDRLGVTLAAAVADLTTARDVQQEQTAEQETAMTSALGAYDDLSDRCRELQAEYEAEQARLRAEAEERARQRAAAASSARIRRFRRRLHGPDHRRHHLPVQPGSDAFQQLLGRLAFGGQVSQGDRHDGSPSTSRSTPWPTGRSVPGAAALGAGRSGSRPAALRSTTPTSAASRSETVPGSVRVT